MRYFVFSRVSGKKQDTEMQRHVTKNFLENILKPGDEVYHFDEGKKSTRRRLETRTILTDMLDRLRKGDVVVVYKFDRLGRHIVDAVKIYYERILKAGATVLSVVEGELNDLLINILSTVAHQELANRSVTTKSALAMKKSKRERTGNIPFGYTLGDDLQLQRENVSSYGKQYKLVPEPTEMAALKMMFELHEKRIGYKTIARMLDDNGFKNRKGQPIDHSTIYYLVRRWKNNDPLLQVA